MKDWEDYGIDWDGPVPEDDINTVLVAEVEDILSTEQKAELDARLLAINPTLCITDSILLHQFATARTFINFCITTGS